MKPARELRDIVAEAMDERVRRVRAELDRSMHERGPRAGERPERRQRRHRLRGEGALALGETYGLIRFGSRLDTFFPADANVIVELGQRAIGGETALAELR